MPLVSMKIRRPTGRHVDASRCADGEGLGITDKGKVRTTNEDQFLVAELTKAMRIWQTSLSEPKLQVAEERAHLFLVADGMGGQQAGERASALAVAAIEQFTLNSAKWIDAVV
jgi:serine/threonine protein phosphatase PrpC